MSVTKKPVERLRFRDRLVFAPTVFVMMALMQFGLQWAMMRFFTYHRAHQVLPADSYDCQIYTAEDYRKLTDPNLDKVELSNGSALFDRTRFWYEIVLPQIKKVDDDHYVQITTLGTAHYLQNWVNATMPMAMLCVFALVASIWSLRRTLREKAEGERGRVGEGGVSRNVCQKSR